MTRDLTSTEAARMLHVCPQTIGRMMARGILIGYTLPGSRHRRFTLDAVRACAEQHGITIELKGTE